MSSCTNKVSYFIEKGYDYREIFIQCGRTDPYGNRTICDECSNNSAKMNAIDRTELNSIADNDWAKSAGWGDF